MPRATARPPARQLVSVATAAEHASLSTRTIRRYIEDGRLRAYRVGARLVKVDLAELDAALVVPIASARDAAGSARNGSTRRARVR